MTEADNGPYLYGENVNQEEAAQMIAMLMLVGTPVIGLDTTLREAGKLVLDAGALIMFPSTVNQLITLEAIPDGWICPDDDSLDNIIQLYREYGEPGLSYLEVVTIAYNVYKIFEDHTTPLTDALEKKADDATSLYNLLVKAA
jgi:hypothetical protein